MLWAVLAALLGVAGASDQLFPTVPDTHITYLGGDVSRPEALKEAPAASATAILFSGGFGFGGGTSFHTALDAAPHVRLVVFDSPGGRPLVADEIATLISARHLDTDVERQCASACTVAFVAGTVRSANVHARFAFHRASAAVLEGLANIVYARMQRTWFVKGGVSLSFGNRALHAPNPTPYLPPLEELVAAGYLHRVRGVATSATVAPPRDADRLFAEIHRLEPQTGALILMAEQRRLANGMTVEQARAIALDEAALVADRWLSRSSDSAIFAVADATLAALSALDPVSCMRWQVGIADQDAGFTMIPEALQEHLLAAEAAVLHDATPRPAPMPPSYADADTAVRAEIAAKAGSRALEDAGTPEHAFDDPAKSCAVSIAYLRGLRDRPEGPGVLRWALAAG